MENSTYSGKNTKGKLRIVVSVLIVLLVVFFSYAATSLYNKKKGGQTETLPKKTPLSEERMNESLYSVKNDEIYKKSLLENKPQYLQDELVIDVQNGVNDKFTKSDAYFIVHRYFDNGGNIYEIYDYVNSHPEMAFLKEAEKIYPDIFANIKSKTVPAHASITAIHALLAYLEVLDNHGYADIAALGTLANQYARTAYFVSVSSKGNQTPAEMASSMVGIEGKKSILFAIKARESFAGLIRDYSVASGSIIDTNNLNQLLTSKDNLKKIDIVPHNLLVGLNQFASSLRYLKAAGFDPELVHSKVSANDIFAFNTVFAKKYVPELEIFTSLLDATTLYLVSPDDVAALKVALQPIINLGVFKKKQTDIVGKILGASKGSLVDIDMYGKRNIATLGNTVPEFKKWLLSNGWVESDFQL